MTLTAQIDMKRRVVLTGGGCTLVGLTAGCLGRLPTVGVDTEFELVDPAVRVDEPPDVTATERTITARGTVQYGSSSCGTVELAHAAYEQSQRRLDLLIAAADDSSVALSCTDDLGETGYRLEATVDSTPRRVAVTEHHVFGETYSTTVDLTE